MRNMSLAAHIFASEAEAVTFKARVPSGSLSHLSGNRFAAPGKSNISKGSAWVVERSYNAPRLAVLILLVLFAIEWPGLLDFFNGAGDVRLGTQVELQD